MKKRICSEVTENTGVDSRDEGKHTERNDLSGNSLKQTVHTRCASVHQAAKLVAALLRVAGVTADLAESNGNLPPRLWLTSPVTCRLSAKNRD